ncbi:MAG: nucleotidyltransferase domain-containing protein [Candidatus Pacearchaeota archaeon]|nr:nucleotidyltransferase domain-containing protein [Candidatus Pacearchaeota archaeon]
MSLKKFLDKLNFLPSNEELKKIREETKKVVEILKKNATMQKIDVEIFVGGSLKKGTIMRNDEYDIDIFARFSTKYEEKIISDLLEKILDEIGKKEKIHGSRDYFRIKKENIVFEIIPVIKIKKPNEAKNVMDLSYFHVNYVKKRAKNKKILREIVLAKKFCKANRIYGAESYVQGFSGYALECLIIYYRTFEKMLREIAKAKDKIIIDIEKKYKNKDEVAIRMNASKIKSPIVLVDPTYKERNVTASLSWETFNKFKKIAKKFLKKPTKKFFEFEELDENKMKNEAKEQKAEFIKIILKTDRQEGDIAGTKMKKFANFLEREVSKYFKIIRSEFDYNGGKEGSLYLIGKTKNEILRKGPPLKMKENAEVFKKINKEVIIKKGVLYAKIKINFSLEEFIEKFYKEREKQAREMGIIELIIKR